jgi:hypothetical protein
VNDQPKAPPAAESWNAEIEELRLRRAEASKLGGAEAVAKHHGQGRLTVRERIDGLVDAGSFQEVGGLTGQGRYVDGKLLGVTPAPYVMGLAAIDGRPVAVGGEDFTVRGGTSWSGDRKKGGQGGFIEDLAASYRIPLVNLIDGSGGSVTSINRRGHAVFGTIFHPLTACADSILAALLAVLALGIIRAVRRILRAWLCVQESGAKKYQPKGHYPRAQAVPLGECAVDPRLHSDPHAVGTRRRTKSRSGNALTCCLQPTPSWHS